MTINNSEIDNLAYEIYEKEYYEKYEKGASVFTKNFFIFHKDCFPEYYNNVEKHLRKKKLENLNIL